MGRAVLVVEDDALMRTFLVEVLAAEGTAGERNRRHGRSRPLGQDAWDLVITDLKMPGLDGLSLLKQGRKIRPEARWIVITAHGSVESAVEAMKAGATDYLLKPFKSPDELRLVVRRALREVESEVRISLLSEELGRDFPPVELIFLGAALITFVILKYFRYGRHLYAMGGNRAAAYVSGINTPRITITAFVVVVLGGMGNILGAFVGGLIIGVADSVGAMFLPGAMKSIISFTIFIIILLLKPAGLFGRKNG
jgi:DNA-binding NarL/FixJ family response regulator